MMRGALDVADLLVVVAILATGDWLWAVLYLDAVLMWWLLESLGQAQAG